MSEIRQFTKIIMSADGTPGASAEAPKFIFEVGSTVKRTNNRPFTVTTKKGKAENVATATVVDRIVEETDGKPWYWLEVIDSIGGEHYGWLPESSLEPVS